MIAMDGSKHSEYAFKCKYWFLLFILDCFDTLCLIRGSMLYRGYTSPILFLQIHCFAINESA